MFRHLTRAKSLLGRRLPPWRQCLSQASTKPPSDPLRILFCGSDTFSCASLKAVYEEHTRNPGLIESLDVMVRPYKHAGRNNKIVREVRCKVLADKLGLRVHQRDTFTGWDLPEGINLIVAVSFGLFVPPRILQSAKYGGINLHPSLLPDLRGPAPIHHAVLRGYNYTGISLQTLHEEKFDHGIVLAQTPLPGIPIPRNCTLEGLTLHLAPRGADMLVQGLRDGLHVPPYTDVGWKVREDKKLTHARKVRKADAQIVWGEWTAEDVVRRLRVYKSVWTYAAHKKGHLKRLLIGDAEVVSEADLIAQHRVISILKSHEAWPNGPRHEIRISLLPDRSCIIPVSKGEYILVKQIKEEGKQWQDALSTLRSF